MHIPHQTRSSLLISFENGIFRQQQEVPLKKINGLEFRYILRPLWSHNVETTSIQCWFNDLMLNQHWIDVVSTLCACWVGTDSLGLSPNSWKFDDWLNLFPGRQIRVLWNIVIYKYSLCFTFIIPWIKSVDYKLVIFFLFSSENRLWHLMQMKTICMKFHSQFSGKSKKNISKWYLLNFYPACLTLKKVGCVLISIDQFKCSNR